MIKNLVHTTRYTISYESNDFNIYTYNIYIYTPSLYIVCVYVWLKKSLLSLLLNISITYIITKSLPIITKKGRLKITNQAMITSIINIQRYFVPITKKTKVEPGVMNLWLNNKKNFNNNHFLTLKQEDLDRKYRF